MEDPVLRKARTFAERRFYEYIGGEYGLPPEDAREAAEVDYAWGLDFFSDKKYYLV